MSSLRRHLGGVKVAKVCREKYGPDFYKKIGKMGGSTVSNATHRKGFGSRRDLASQCGAKGGAMSVPYSKNPKRKTYA